MAEGLALRPGPWLPLQAHGRLAVSHHHAKGLPAVLPAITPGLFPSRVPLRGMLLPQMSTWLAPSP